MNGARMPALAVVALAFLAGCSLFMSDEAEEAAAIDKSLHKAALSAQQSNDYGLALRYFRQLYTANPSDLTAALGYARNLRYTGTPGRAAQVLETALKVAPEDTRLMAELGKVRIATGRPHEAVELLDKALSLGEADWRSYAALGIANDHIGERMQALQAYEAAQVLSPDNVAIINNMALSAALAGDMEEGTRLLEKAATLPGATAQVRQNLALLYGIGGKLVAAERLARLDLPADLVARNIAYYREMRDGVQQRDLGPEGNGNTHRPYVIEVGPYATAQQAIKGWRSISGQDVAYSQLKVEIVSRRIGQRPMTEYLAAAGPFPSRDSAKNACSKLQARNLMCWVVQQ
mgnify:CR=1 FL=1